jgi:hypothetical protein
MTQLKEAIYDYIKHHPGTSFAELDRIKGVSGGDVQLTIDSLVLWAGLTEDGAKAIQELLGKKLIKYQGAPEFIYLIDGKRLNLPIAKTKAAIKAKKPRWLPVVFNVVK